MKVVFAAIRDDYGDPRRGPSFEEQTFLPTLARMGHEVIPFDFLAQLRDVGYESMNERLFRLVKEEEPDVLFCVLFEEQLDMRVVSRITEETPTLTVNWFCDDHWRFDGFSRHWAPCFDWIATTDRRAYERYRAMGLSAIHTQWAWNSDFLPPHGVDLTHSVTFVGQPHSDRRQVVERLRKAGVETRCWGHGWPAGRLGVEQMASVFASSRINLNLAGASSRGRRFRKKRITQLKARPFEIAGCGGFVLTEYVERLEDYFELDTEIVAFRSTAELIEKAQHFLADEPARERIARAGCARVRSAHTYERRFTEIFAAMGLESSSSLAVMAQ